MFLDSLFRATDTVKLPNEEVTVRALGDAETRLREQMARNHSSALRKLLSREETYEFETYVKPLLLLEDKDLRDNLVSFYNRVEAETEARDNINPQFVVEPDDATFNEKLDTDEAQKEADKAYEEALRREIEGLTDTYKSTVEGFSHDTLVLELKEKAVTYFAYGEYLRFLVISSIFLSTERDGKRRFQSTSDVENLPRQVIDVLQNKFSEVNNKDIWEITKETLRGN